eukprot:UN20787
MAKMMYFYYFKFSKWKKAYLLNPSTTGKCLKMFVKMPIGTFLKILNETFSQITCSWLYITKERSYDLPSLTFFTAGLTAPYRELKNPYREFPIGILV